MIKTEDIGSVYRWMNNDTTEVFAKSSGGNKIMFVTTEDDFVQFCVKNQDSLLLAGINPRPPGLNRPATDNDIEIVQSFYLDYDIEKENPTPEDSAELALFLEKVMSALEDQGFQRPRKCFTGNGYHLIFALEPISLSENPDIKLKLKAFRDEIFDIFQDFLYPQGPYKLDSTFDLRRMIKIYGTSKPYVGARLSEWDGDDKRFPDKVLTEYILSLNPKPRKEANLADSSVNSHIPTRFYEMLKTDPKLNRAWQGEWDDPNIEMRSGHDAHLASLLMHRGFTNNEAVSILMRFPHGKAGERGQEYALKTIENVKNNLNFEIPPGLDGLIKLQGEPNSSTGIKTCFTALNNKIDGLSDFIILGAGPKVGKTTFAIQIGVFVAREGIPVIYVDLENGKYRLINRIKSSLSRISVEEIITRKMSAEQVKRLSAVVNEIGTGWGRYFRIVDGGISQKSIKKAINNTKIALNADRVLVIVDSLQKLPAHNTDNRRDTIDEWLRFLENLKISMGCTILAISELRRGSYYNSTLDSFKESGDIEYTADTALLMVPTNNDKTVQLRIVASRDGEVGPVALYRPIKPFWHFNEIEK